MINTSFASLSFDKLDNDGFVLISPVCDTLLIDQVLKEVSLAFSSIQVIKVNADDIIIKTLNGNQLIELCPSVQLIYENVLDNLRKVMPQIVELDDNTIGISSNFLGGQADKFRLHFDRNQLTVVIYLNDLDEFPLVLYPNIRRDPVLTGVKDKFDLESTKSEAIFPKQNLAVVFYGRRTFHGVSNLNTFENVVKQRYSLQFAFDFDQSDYSGQQYYGKSST